MRDRRKISPALGSQHASEVPHPWHKATSDPPSFRRVSVWAAFVGFGFVLWIAHGLLSRPISLTLSIVSGACSVSRGALLAGVLTSPSRLQDTADYRQFAEPGPVIQARDSQVGLLTPQAPSHVPTDFCAAHHGPVVESAHLAIAQLERKLARMWPGATGLASRQELVDSWWRTWSNSSAGQGLWGFSVALHRNKLFVTNEGGQTAVWWGKHRLNWARAMVLLLRRTAQHFPLPSGRFVIHASDLPVNAVSGAGVAYPFRQNVRAKKAELAAVQAALPSMKRCMSKESPLDSCLLDELVANLQRHDYSASSEAARPYLPFMAPCSTREHWDIPAPHFDFYLEDHGQIAEQVERRLLALPWSSRNPSAIFRGRLYCETECSTCSRYVATCQSAKSPLASCTSSDSTLPVLDIGITRSDDAACAMPEHCNPYKDRIDLLDHAWYRSSVHLEGTSYSSRRSKLYVTGTAVLEQESAFDEFFDLMVVPGRHNMPFRCHSADECSSLQTTAESLLRNSTQALEISRHAWNEIGVPHFAPRSGPMCYWYSLLTGLAARHLLPSPLSDAFVEDAVSKGLWTEVPDRLD